MKITTNRTVENNLGSLETHRVSIAANGKAFSTLVKGIYENKIRAFVREISTNALDSHIEAGIADMPFHVSFPDVFDPYFRVRDYGVSMTHEQVFAIFGTLFESTKDQSNDVVGAFGLGRKSPLAYADSFNVTAFLDGEARVYLVTIDETGAPTISLLSTEDTDKPDGIEVAVPIREADFNRVAEEGRSVLSVFDVVPTNNIGIEPVTRYFSTDDGSAFVIKAPNTHSRELLEVRQGCVMYPVSDWSLTSQLQGKISWGFKLILDVPIGTYGVTTSREALELDEQTRADIVERVGNAIDCITKEIESKFDSAPNFLEATKFYLDNGVDSFWSARVSYKGKPLSGWVSFVQDKSSGGKDHYEWVSKMVPHVRTGNKRAVASMRTIDIQNIDKVIFVVDTPNQNVPRASLRYRNLVAENGDSRTFLLTNPSPKLLARMQRLLGLRSNQIVSVASLPDPGPSKRGTTTVKTNNVSGVTTSAEYGGAVTELPEDFYWIEISRPNRWDRDSARQLRSEVITNGGDNLDILIFSPTAAKRYKPNADRNIYNARKILFEQKSDDIAEAFKLSFATYGLIGIALDAVKCEGFDPNLADKARFVFDHEQMEALRGEGESIRREWKRRFPLLIDPTDSDWEDYISSQSEESN